MANVRLMQYLLKSSNWKNMLQREQIIIEVNSQGHNLYKLKKHIT